jgi:hypothetical protein
MKPLVLRCAVVVLLAIPGCGPSAMVNNADSRAKLADALVANPGATAVVVDRLVSSDTTRSIVIDRVLANGEARQELMLKAARDRTMLEGMLNVAVQDTAMRAHVMTLVRGMQMMER